MHQLTSSHSLLGNISFFHINYSLWQILLIIIKSIKKSHILPKIYRVHYIVQEAKRGIFPYPIMQYSSVLEATLVFLWCQVKLCRSQSKNKILYSLSSLGFCKDRGQKRNIFYLCLLLFYFFLRSWRKRSRFWKLPETIFPRVWFKQE